MLRTLVTIGLVYVLHMPSTRGQIAHRHAPVTKDIGRCVEEYELPMFGPTALGDGSGRVVVVAHTDAKGEIVRTELEGGGDGHRKEVDRSVREMKLRKECAGQRIELVFRFVVLPGERDKWFTFVKFVGPNQFVLSRHRQPLQVN